MSSQEVAQDVVAVDNTDITQSRINAMASVIERIKATQKNHKGTQYCVTCGDFRPSSLEADTLICDVCKNEIVQSTEPLAEDVLYTQRVKYIQHRDKYNRFADHTKRLIARIDHCIPDSDSYLQVLNTLTEYLAFYELPYEHSAGVTYIEQRTGRRCTVANMNKLLHECLYKNVGRNDLCPCNSGKKYKKCHLLLKPL